MRLVLLLLSVTSASAQQTPGPVDVYRPDNPSRVVRILVGTTVSLGLPVAFYYAGSDEAAAAAAVGIPLTAALAVHYAGTDGSGSFGRTFAGAGLGVLSGVVLLGAGQIASGLDSCGDFCIVPYIPDAVVLVLGPAIGAGLMYRGRRASATPVVLVGPDGERVAGLSLRIGL